MFGKSGKASQKAWCLNPNAFERVVGLLTGGGEGVESVL